MINYRDDYQVVIQYQVHQESLRDDDLSRDNQEVIKMIIKDHQEMIIYRDDKLSKDYIKMLNY